MTKLVVVTNLVVALVTNFVVGKVTNLVIQAHLIRAETIQVAQEAQNVREAESTVLTTSTG